MLSKKNILKSFLLIAIGFALNACNTMEGVGKDIEAGGNKLKNTASENK